MLICMPDQHLLAWSQLQEAEVIPEIFNLAPVKSPVTVAFGLILA